MTSVPPWIGTASGCSDFSRSASSSERGVRTSIARKRITLSRHGGAPPPAGRRSRRRARRPRRPRRPRASRSSRRSGSNATSRSSTASSPGSASYEGRETLDAVGRFVVPGFIDAHMHLESVKLMVDEFARLVLPLGTTAVVADPHEIANVLGVDGVHWLLDASAGLQLDVFFMASSCVPASPFESPRRPLGPGDLESLMRRRRVLGLAEMMNFPGVIDGATRRSSTKLALDGARARRRPRAGRPREGAAGVRGVRDPLGPRGADRRRGPRAAARRDVAARARGVDGAEPASTSCRSSREYGPGRIAFCTDDRDPDDIVDDGHVNGMVRKAVAAGVAPEDALLMASYHPALWHGLRRHGAIAPGYQADLARPPRPRRASSPSSS